MHIFRTSKAISDLEKRIDQLETTVKHLDLEWSSTYDKFRSILARIAKRSERLAAVESGENSAGFQEASNGSTGSTGLLPSLNQRQASINELILARRNRLKGPTQ